MDTLRKVIKSFCIGALLLPIVASGIGCSAETADEVKVHPSLEGVDTKQLAPGLQLELCLTNPTFFNTNQEGCVTDFWNAMADREGGIWGEFVRHSASAGPAGDAPEMTYSSELCDRLKENDEYMEWLFENEVNCDSHDGVVNNVFDSTKNDFELNDGGLEKVISDDHADSLTVKGTIYEADRGKSWKDERHYDGEVIVKDRFEPSKADIDIDTNTPIYDILSTLSNDESRKKVMAGLKPFNVNVTCYKTWTIDED
jgi:hypothetical protein